MSYCNHGWRPPRDKQCPDCLYEEANKFWNDAHRLDIVHNAVANAIALMPYDKDKAEVEKVRKQENNWKCIKVAREIRQDYLARRRRG